MIQNPVALAKANRISLKDDPRFDEAWLQGVIAADPSLLGLGELDLIERERRQPRAGRLDLLLANMEENCRYEVELMLGSTDESHIVRTLEYWDVERRRYPAYNHIAVLVAEDVTSRFLNVLSLFAGSIELIVLQATCLEIEGRFVLHFVKVLDSRGLLRQDDESQQSLEVADRNYWLSKTSSEVLAVVDRLLSTINDGGSPPVFDLNYNKQYIGLSEDQRSRNFIHFKPSKRFLRVLAEVPDRSQWLQTLEQCGLDVSPYGPRWLNMKLAPGNEEQLKIAEDVLQKAVQSFKMD